MEIKKLRELAKKNLSEKRYNHTLEVEKLAKELAKAYSINTQYAQIAAILHDITKEKPRDEQLQTIKKSDIMLDTVFYKSESLMHSITAFIYAKQKLGITNQDILNAIRYHTTARANMSMLEKIIYVADACSYERNYSGVQIIRDIAFYDINKCILKIIEFNILKILKNKGYIAPDSIDCYNSILTSGEV